MKMMLGVALSAILATTAYSAETTIKITDDVVVKDCINFGVNFNTTSVKKPILFNFEGQGHRIALHGEIFPDGYLAYDFNIKYAVDVFELDKYYVGADVTVLSGDAKGQKRKIKKVELRRRMSYYWRIRKETKEIGNRLFFVFDKPITGLQEDKRTDLVAVYKANKRGEKAAGEAYKSDPNKNVGVLIEKDYMDTGFYGYHYKNFTYDKDGIKIKKGDTPSNSFGNSSLEVSKAISFTIADNAIVDCNGIANISFWAKSQADSSTLAMEWSDPKELGKTDISLTSEWKKFEYSFDLTGKYPSKPTPLNGDGVRLVKLSFTPEGGSFLIDDIEMSIDKDKNKTAFRDSVVETLQEFKPGIIRQLMEGGDSIKNMIAPRIEQYMFEGSVNRKKEDPGLTSWFSKRRFFVNMHEYYGLCKKMGTSPWYNISGTIYPNEMNLLMEYLGGPAGTTGGDIRIKQGQEKPWTEVLPNIYIEFGNEIWNFIGDYRTSSFDGPDYWEGLIQLGKKSQFFKNNIKFVMGTQNAKRFHVVPSTDYLMMNAPYILHSLSRKDIERHETKEDLFKWVFGYGLEQNLFARNIMEASKTAKEMDKELAVYEVNYHAVGPADTLKERNELVASLAGGVNLANSMLAQMKVHGVRNQCFFNFGGGPGGYKNTALWAGVINVRKENRRYRPTWLGLLLSNKIINGDLVKTVHSGANPKFTTVDKKGKKKKEYPLVYSYAFNSEKEKGVVLVNLDLSKSQNINLEFSGNAKNAKKFIMHNKDFTANNEDFSISPKVNVVEKKMKNLKSGAKIELPACSIIGIKWEKQ